MPESLLEALRRFLTGDVCILGIGNRDRGDDGVGSMIVDNLRKRVAADLIDAGGVHENHLERCVQCEPDAVLILDAMDLGAEPGAVRLVSPARLRGAGVSTHGSPLALSVRYLEERTGARVALLGIQPADVAAGTGLSPEVAAAAGAVAKALERLLPAGRPAG